MAAKPNGRTTKNNQMAELQKQQPNGRTTKYTPCRDDDTLSKNRMSLTRDVNLLKERQNAP